MNKTRRHITKRNQHKPSQVVSRMRQGKSFASKYQRPRRQEIKVQYSRAPFHSTDPTQSFFYLQQFSHEVLRRKTTFNTEHAIEIILLLRPSHSFCFVERRDVQNFYVICFLKNSQSFVNDAQWFRFIGPDGDERFHRRIIAIDENNRCYRRQFVNFFLT